MQVLGWQMYSKRIVQVHVILLRSILKGYLNCEFRSTIVLRTLSRIKP